MHRRNALPPRARPCPSLQDALRNVSAPAGRQVVLLLVNTTVDLSPQPALQWPPPGGVRVPVPLIISGVSAASTTLALGAGAPGVALAGPRPDPSAAPVLLQLPANASDGHLQIQLASLAHLGTGPLRGGGNSSAPAAAGQRASQAAASSSRRRLQAAEPASAAMLPEPGCWNMLLWSVRRAVDK